MKRHRDKNRYASNELRLKILKRDKFKCRYCLETVLMNTAHIDHVIPWSKGGKTTSDNLVASCNTCNIAKSNHTGIAPKTLEELGLVAKKKINGRGIPKVLHHLLGTPCKHRKSPKCRRTRCLQARLELEQIWA